MEELGCLRGLLTLPVLLLPLQFSFQVSHVSEQIPVFLCKNCRQEKRMLMQGGAGHHSFFNGWSQLSAVSPALSTNPVRLPNEPGSSFSFFLFQCVPAVPG